MKFSVIDEHRGQYPLGMMCKALEVSQSGYHLWRKRPPSFRSSEEYRLVRLIESIHHGSRKTYGSPRIHAVLNGLGESCSKPRVERLMRKYGIRAKTKKRFKATTNSVTIQRSSNHLG